MYASFGEIERLDTATLRELLVGGEPPERVWAAWALGLRHDPDFAHELRATAAEEPDAGVRRHLVVILAGAGESKSVLTMAAHDPDERVRATALQYVARLAQPREPAANELLARALAGGTPLERLGCVAGLRPDAPPALWDAVDACVPSADRDLRWAAYEAVMRHRGETESAPERTRLFLNPEPELSTRRAALALLHERAGVHGLRRLVDDVALDARAAPDVIEALHTHTVQLEWAGVDRLLGRFQSVPWRHRILQLLAVGQEGPARAGLLRLFVADRVDPENGWEMRPEIGTRLQRALDDNRGPLDDSEHRLRQALADFVEKEAADARADPEFLDKVDIAPALRPDIRPGEPFDPLSFPWFCEAERDVLAQLALLEVH